MSHGLLQGAANATADMHSNAYSALCLETELAAPDRRNKTTGIDGSVLVHYILQSNMAAIILEKDLTSFLDTYTSALIRL